MLRNEKAFEQARKSRHDPGPRIRLSVVDDEDRLTVFPATITRGLIAVLAPAQQSHARSCRRPFPARLELAVDCPYIHGVGHLRAALYLIFQADFLETLMATGWAGDGAVQDQIDATVNDAVSRARRQLKRGPGLTHCEACEATIPEARRKAVPGVRLCVSCQEVHDQEQATTGTYNRRGSKDSQLR